MPKIFDRTFSGLYVPKRLNEDVWFKRHQKLLLWMAAHPEGRKLLCLDQTNIGEIHRIRKNSVGNDRYLTDGMFRGKVAYRRVSTTDFRVGAKWANLIRFQWDWYCELAREYTYEQKAVGLWSPFGLVPGLAFTTSTFYPDPHTESTTVDGYIANVDSVYLTCRNAASGNSAGDDDGDGGYTTHEKRAVPDFRIYRNATLFDTAADIPDTDDISSATYSINWAAGTSDADSDSISIVTSTPASNTALTTADFDQFGTTKLATDQTFASITADQYYDFALNATGIAAISKTGITKLGWRTAKDIAATEPAGLNQRNFNMAESTGTSQDPKLVAIHAAAAAATGNFLLIF